MWGIGVHKYIFSRINKSNIERNADKIKKTIAYSL